jgi:hypothetical protein
VFPYGTVWLVGTNDVLMLATTNERRPEIGRIADRMTRVAVAADLASIGVIDRFSITSLMIGRPEDLSSYTAESPIFTDDRLTLEFTAPREIHRRRAGNGPAIPAAVLGSHSSAASSVQKIGPRCSPGPIISSWRWTTTGGPSTTVPLIRRLDGLVKMAVILKRPAECAQRDRHRRHGRTHGGSLEVAGRRRQA